MSEHEQPVLVEARNGVGHLSLNRPAALNALSLPMIRLLWQQLQAWEQDPAIHVVVLRASAGKAFCAGGDIRSLYDSYKNGDDLHQIFFEEEYALDQYIHGYPKPVVALLDGFVLGGGMGLAQGATLRVVTERARLGMPETGIGYFPDVGSSYFLSRLPGELGLYLGITGVQIHAADALYAQLADWYLPSDKLAELDHGLDQLDATVPPLEALNALLAKLASRKLLGAELKTLRPAIDEYFSLPNLSMIRAALQHEDRPEYQDWAEQTLKLLDSRSPLAMSVTLELLRRGRTMSLTTCFELELHLDRQWFARGDLIEGVRALIVDKDKMPRWNPPVLSEVDDRRVGEFFSDFHPARATAELSATT